MKKMKKMKPVKTKKIKMGNHVTKSSSKDRNKDRNKNSKNTGNTGKPKKASHPSKTMGHPKNKPASRSAPKPSSPETSHETNLGEGIIMGHKTPEEMAEIHSQIRDEADWAQAINLASLDAIQELAKKMNQKETHPDFDGKNCLDCTAAIPKKRLELGKIRCVDCQGFLEEKAKHR